MMRTKPLRNESLYLTGAVARAAEYLILREAKLHFQVTFGQRHVRANVFGLIGVRLPLRLLE
jgi:hypothetical protein